MPPLTADHAASDAPPVATAAVPTGHGRRGRSRSRRRRDALAALAFLSPALAALLIMRLYPMVRAVLDSLHRSLPGSTEPPRWVGLDNFDGLLHSSAFWQSVKQTLIFNVVINPLQVAAALV